mmetsp:Transcript_23915/g.55639  ORF Transcript_23915/g.55639 Transcript_23915/m.55639 type:complete len:93 (+) Transcript_23915:72-350(+)
MAVAALVFTGKLLSETTSLRLPRCLLRALMLLLADARRSTLLARGKDPHCIDLGSNAALGVEAPDGARELAQDREPAMDLSNSSDLEGADWG